MAQGRVFRNAEIATLATPEGLGFVTNGAIVAEHGEIVFVGPEADLPSSRIAGYPALDCGGRLITPGLIDCHTHLIHGGSRAWEFEQRLRGTSYAEISAQGGGIVSTVKATRAATEASLMASAGRRLDALIAEGVTTVEIKSGYGLDRDTELRMLRVARALATARDVDVATSFLGLHALPPDYAGNADAYVDHVCREILPAVVADGLADAVDGFCESIAFSPAQIARFFTAARAMGLPVKLHADQLSNLHGAGLAAGFSALSADHLEYTDESGVVAMAASGTVAVLLPGAYYTLRETCPPPVGLLRGHGVAMAVATDCNPGTSPMTSILLAMNMAATLFGLTVEECLAGVTRHAATALGRQVRIGVIAPGAQCDLAIWDVSVPAELVYRIGFNPLYARIRRGS